MMRTFLSIFAVPLFVMAIESISPSSLCDRFINSKDQKACQSKMKSLEPDSYLAGTCQKEFEDENFWQCMELGKSSTFDPKKLDKCDSSEMNDKQRIDCVKQAQTAEQMFQRLPASK